MKNLLILLFAAFALASCTGQPYTLNSKTSDLEVSLNLSQEGALTIELYEVDNKERELIIKSPISLNISGSQMSWELLKSKKSKTTETINMPYGEFSQVSVPYSDMVCNVKLKAIESSYNATLTVRLFEGSFAYRVEIDGLPDNTILSEGSQWIPASLDGACYATNGEHETLGPLAISKAKKLNRTPFIYQDSKRIIALNECDLFNYPQLSIQGAEDGSALNIKNNKCYVSGDFALPWRVVMVGENYGDLHNQKPIYQTMSRPAQGDFSWVKPGVSTWDWRVKGTTFDGFTYGMDTESHKRFIDFCSRQNIAYLIIDDEWFHSSTPLVPVEGFDVREVVRYGKEKGVGIILYYDTTYFKKSGHPVLDFEEVAATYADFGVAGMKYGFLAASTLQKKTQMTHDIITTAAKYKLIVDFHDSPIPFSGMERTYPNYITREYCHAQLDRRAAFNPRQFVKMACVNLLAGHVDQTNGTFSLNEMATRQKGPRNAYNSTVAAEVARFVFSHTGSLSVLIDAPEAYEAKADLFEAIKRIPKRWDETKYLDMKYNSHVAVAKRAGEMWYASVVYGEKGGVYELDLDFLTPGAKYTATIYRDAEDTDYKTNKEAYKIEKRNVTSDDEIKLKVTAGGGFTVIFDKQ